MSGEEYIIKGGVSGRERLRILSRAIAPYTNALLDDVSIARGARILDVGCGGGDVTFELARRAGPTGHVLGIDIDPVKIALDLGESAKNVEFRLGDVTTEDFDAQFDVVYARFVMSHLKDPLGALAHMRAALKSGGVLIVEDVDFDGHFCQPPRPAFDHYVAWYKEAARQRGANALLGRHLPELVAKAGFEMLQARAQNPAACDGELKQIAVLTLAAIADAVISQGIADRTAVGDAIDDLQQVANDPSVFMSVPRIVQVWARAP